MKLLGLFVIPLLSLAAVLAQAGCGQSSREAATSVAQPPTPTQAALAVTEVQVTLTEFKVESTLNRFESGKSYRFVISNRGALSHEWSIAERGGHAHAAMVVAVGEDRLTPGATVTVEHTFPPGTRDDLEIACHVAGHYEAGMHTDIEVTSPGNG